MPLTVTLDAPPLTVVITIREAGLVLAIVLLASVTVTVLVPEPPVAKGFVKFTGSVLYGVTSYITFAYSV